MSQTTLPPIIVHSHPEPVIDARPSIERGNQRPPHRGGRQHDSSVQKPPRRAPISIIINGHKFKLSEKVAVEFIELLKDYKTTSNAGQIVGFLSAVAFLFGITSDLAEGGAWVVTGGANDEQIVLKSPNIIDKALRIPLAKKIQHIIRRSYQENRNDDAKTLERILDVIKQPLFYEKNAITIRNGKFEFPQMPMTTEQSDLPLLSFGELDIQLMERVLAILKSTSPTYERLISYMSFPFEWTDDNITIMRSRDYGILSYLLFWLSTDDKRKIVEMIDNRNDNIIGRFPIWFCRWESIIGMMYRQDNSWRAHLSDKGTSIDSFVINVE